MVIGVCGYGYSGSGAVLDFLREVKECSCALVEEGQEFLLPYIPGGIEDLEYQLMERKTRYLSSDGAIKSFLKMIRAMDSPRSFYRRLTNDRFHMASVRFVRKISQICWNGTSYTDNLFKDQPYRSLMARKNRFIRAYEQKRGCKWNYSEKNKMYLSVAPDNFYDAAHDYLCEVLDMFGYDRDKVVLLNQPFDVYEPDRSMKYFDDPVAVIVDRDPRDIYSLAKMVLWSKASWMPTDDVHQFVRYHRLVRQRSYREERFKVIRLQYEDMIYKYEETSSNLLRHLGLEKSEREARKYFDPALSIENTQLYLKYPNLQEDLKIIEQELPEYLYPFEKMAQRPKGEGQPF